MKTNPTDLATDAQQCFAASDAHDVEGMTALFTDGARGRYAPNGRESVVPIRGGIDVIWRAFPQAVPNFRVIVQAGICWNKENITDESHPSDSVR
jgi:hypothetical protein